MRILLLFFVFLVYSFWHFACSQEPLKAERKTYVDENNRLFIHKNLPVYLWISTSPDSLSKKFRLRSDTMPQYTNPMYFDTDGFNSVRTRGLVSNKSKLTVSADQDVFFPVYGDSRPPDSYTIIQSSYFKWEDGQRVYKDEVILDILAYDMFSGIQQIYYSVNGESYKLYTGQLKIEKEGNIMIHYYALDNVGNREEPKELRFKIEKN